MSRSGQLHKHDVVDLASLQSQFAAIVESSDDAIIGKSLDGKITSWNEGAQRIYGYSAEEIIGKSVALLAPPDRADEIPQILKRLKAGTRIGHYETKRRRKDGRIIDISLTVSPIKNTKGQIVGASAIGRDITLAKRGEEALRRAHQELSERTAELVRSNTELQRFAYVAAHDLQEPTRTVASFCELLERRYGEQLDDRAREWIGFAVTGARRMQMLITDLLSYSRLPSRTRRFAPVDCTAVLTDALANLHLSIEETGAKVTNDPLPTVAADASQLVQLFQNLIGNGIKFHGGEPPHVHVAVERRGDEWIFSVRDNGIGIEPQHRDRIFDIFRRLHPLGTYPGTGIGLATCKRVVEQHRGRIWAESEPGKGSIFYFALPAQVEALS